MRHRKKGKPCRLTPSATNFEDILICLAQRTPCCTSNPSTSDPIAKSLSTGLTRVRFNLLLPGSLITSTAIFLPSTGTSSFHHALHHALHHHALHSLIPQFTSFVIACVISFSQSSLFTAISFPPTFPMLHSYLCIYTRYASCCHYTAFLVGWWKCEESLQQ